MFGIVCSSLLSEDQASADVDTDDKSINEGEILVRRYIIQHLTLNPKHDLPSSLAVLSIVHDVERIGDYAKSLLELNRFSHLCEGDSEYARQSREIHDDIAPLFGQVREALRESDVETATQVMARHEQIKKRIDEFLESVMQDAGTQRDAVLYSLAVRFLRRTSAHLGNIASSVVNPLDRISGKATPG